MDIFGSIKKIVSKMVAIPFIRPDAIIEVDALSGAINDAYKADNTPIVYMAVMSILITNNLIGISLKPISFK